jgi:hypothetical protein
MVAKVGTFRSGNSMVIPEAAKDSARYSPLADSGPEANPWM